MTLDEILDPIYFLPDISRQKLKTIMEEVSYTKNHILLKAGKVENYIYLIKKGIVRAFSERDDHEITFWFGREGSPVISMKNYTNGEVSYENIELLEYSEFIRIKHSDLESLYQEDIHVANWGRKLAETELVLVEERFISRQFKTASERYQELMDTNPELLQRVQLGYIASYLGITQVSLSRIRSEIR